MTYPPQSPDTAKFRYSAVVTTIGEENLTNCVKSIQTQLITPAEVIVVDDSANQNINLDNVIIVKSGGEKGPSHSRNIGISRATEKWVALCDSDDPWLPNKIKNQAEDIAARKLDFSLTSAYVMKKRRPKVVLTPEINPFELLYGKVHFCESSAYFPTGSFLFNKEKVGQFDVNLSDRENIDFLFKAYKSGLRIGQLSSGEIEVSYDSKKSLKRLDIEQEYDWYLYLLDMDLIYARSFKYESIRNVFRTKNVKKIRDLLLEHFKTK